MARAAQLELIFIDTHVLMWLHDGLTGRLSSAAIAAIERGRLYIPAISELELQYLHEIGRFRPTAAQAVRVLAEEIGLRRGDFPFSTVVAEALDLVWTRDPFDRLIVAETLVAGGKLVTKDEAIRAHFAAALW